MSLETNVELGGQMVKPNLAGSDICSDTFWRILLFEPVGNIAGMILSNTYCISVYYAI